MKAAFTLLELIVALLIVGVLIAIAVPVTSGFLARSRSVKCLANLRSLGMGLNLYLNENNSIMPDLAAARRSLDEDVRVIDNTLDAFLDDRRVFSCPGDSGIAAKSGTSYYWNSALSGQPVGSLNFLGLVTDVTRIPVLVDKEAWHPESKDKVNHLFADGHVDKQLRLFSEP